MPPASSSGDRLERHEEKEIDPRLDEINQRLARIEEALKETSRPGSDAEA